MIDGSLENLFGKYLERKCTPVEEAELMRRVSDPANEELISQWIERAYDNPSPTEKLPEAVSGEILHYILSRTSSKPVMPLKTGQTRFVWRKVAAALALLLISCSAFYYMFVHGLQEGKDLTEQVSALPDQREDVEPGGYYAFLTLADETIVSLDRMEPGIIARQSGANILKTSAGELKYAAADQPGKEMTDPEYNILTTPRGGQYQMALPDGSLVWLNANSSLRFPTSFTGDERRVVLRGEAYFEIAHQSDAPFVVQVDSHQGAPAGMEVEVLGTHFNIMAYEDEKTIATTLIEGGLRISDLSDYADHIEIYPGQQLRFESSGAVSLRTVKASDYIAWKEGYFVFNNEHIEDIMRSLARWYDVDYHISSELTYSHFSARVSRFENISKVLEKFELTSIIAFEISDSQVRVKPG